LLPCSSGLSWITLELLALHPWSLRSLLPVLGLHSALCLPQHPWHNQCFLVPLLLPSHPHLSYPLGSLSWCLDLAPEYTRAWPGGYWTLLTTCTPLTATSLPWYLDPSLLHSPFLALTSDWLASVPLGPCLAHLGHSNSLGLQPIGWRLPYQVIAPCSPWSFPIRSCPCSPPVPPFPFDLPVPSTSAMLYSTLYPLL
jgi:hypothetical protein